MNRIQSSFLFFILLTSLGTMRAQSSATVPGLNESLSHNSIWVMLQDSRGVMWIGTKEGLNCYNGYDNTVYRHDSRNPLSIGNSFIRALYEVVPGEELWVGTDEGLYIHDMRKDTFTPFETATAEGRSIVGTVNSIAAMGDELWIAEVDQGIYRYNLTTGTLKFYNTNNFHWSIATDHHGGFWASSFQGGVFRYDPKGDEFQFIAVNNREVFDSGYDTRCFYADATNDCLWIGTLNKGLIKYDFKTNKWSEYQVPGEGSLYEIKSVCRFSYNELAIGTEQGFFTFNTVPRNSHGRPTSPPSSRSFATGRGDSGWVPTTMGYSTFFPVTNLSTSIKYPKHKDV